MKPTAGRPGAGWRVVSGRNRPQAPSKAARIFVWIFGVVMSVTAGTAFVFKLVEFALIASRDGSTAMTSFLVPVLNYLMVSAGFGCLFIWAVITGQFRDIERAKYRMLDAEERWGDGAAPEQGRNDRE